MRIFSDFHHQGLAESLRIVFEDRLGHELYFPSGIDWFDEGYWHIGDCYGSAASQTALQFLTQAIPHDGTAPIIPHRTITLSQFKETKFDIIVCTHEANISAYQKLIKYYQPSAKFVFQVGNDWKIPDSVTHVMASIAPFPYPKDKHVVFYHQEFPIPPYVPAPTEKNIFSFSNAFGINDIFRDDYRDFLQLEHLLPEFNFRSYGGGCRDGSVLLKQVPETMQQAQFILHFKSGGDGYGHVLHQASAVGRPILYKGSQYKGKLAEKLLTNCLTGIDVELLQTESLVKLLRSLTQTDIEKMSLAAYERFREVVDFTSDALALKTFIESL